MLPNSPICKYYASTIGWSLMYITLTEYNLTVSISKQLVDITQGTQQPIHVFQMILHNKYKNADTNLTQQATYMQQLFYQSCSQLNWSNLHGFSRKSVYITCLKITPVFQLLLYACMLLNAAMHNNRCSVEENKYRVRCTHICAMLDLSFNCMVHTQSFVQHHKTTYMSRCIELILTVL